MDSNLNGCGFVVSVCVRLERLLSWTWDLIPDLIGYVIAKTGGVDGVVKKSWQ